jgi:hypothetical protein
MSRPRATDQLHVRIPPAEKAELAAEARRNRISMSALVRISIMTAREHRQRARHLKSMYPRP